MAFTQRTINFAALSSAALAATSVLAATPVPAVHAAEPDATDRAPVPAPDPKAETDTREDRIRLQMSVRGGMGLDGSQDTVAKLVDSSDAWFEFGVLGTAEEMPKVRQQMAVQSALQRADGPIAEKLGASYAGVWIDHAHGAAISIASTEPVDAKQFSDLFPEGTEIKPVRFERSLADLYALQKDIDGRLTKAEWTVSGTDVAYTSIDVQKNTVEIGIVGDGGETAVRSALPDDDAIRYTFGAKRATAIGRTDYPPIMGGYQVHRENPTSKCTVGFNAQRDSGGSTGFLTAGHCQGQTLTGWPWYVGHTNGAGALLGNSATWLWGGSTDALFVNGPSGSAGLVYTGPRPGTTKQWRDVKGWWTNGVASGSLVEISAGASDWTHSNWLYQFSVTHAYATANPYHAETITNMQSAHLCAKGGDSGSPVYTVDENAGAWAGGMAAATTADEGCPDDEVVYWTRINVAMDTLDVHLLTR